MNYPKTARSPFHFQSGVHRAHRQATLHFEREARALGLTGPDGHLLGFVAANEPCPLGELVRVFGHKRSTLTSMLDRFESRGLMVRELSKHDRRSFDVRLTLAGRRLARRAREVALSLERSIGGQVTAADVSGFDRVLAAFAAASGETVRPARSRPLTKSSTGSRPSGGRKRPITRPKERNRA